MTSYLNGEEPDEIFKKLAKDPSNLKNIIKIIKDIVPNISGKENIEVKESSAKSNNVGVKINERSINLNLTLKVDTNEENNLTELKYFRYNSGSEHRLFLFNLSDENNTVEYYQKSYALKPIVAKVDDDIKKDILNEINVKEESYLTVNSLLSLKDKRDLLGKYYSSDYSFKNTYCNIYVISARLYSTKLEDILNEIFGLEDIKNSNSYFDIDIRNNRFSDFKLGITDEYLDLYKDKKKSRDNDVSLIESILEYKEVYKTYSEIYKDLSNIKISDIISKDPENKFEIVDSILKKYFERKDYIDPNFISIRVKAKSAYSKALKGKGVLKTNREFTNQNKAINFYLSKYKQMITRGSYVPMYYGNEKELSRKSMNIIYHNNVNVSFNNRNILTSAANPISLSNISFNKQKITVNDELLGDRLYNDVQNTKVMSYLSAVMNIFSSLKTLTELQLQILESMK